MDEVDAGTLKGKVDATLAPIRVEDLQVTSGKRNGTPDLPAQHSNLQSIEPAG